MICTLNTFIHLTLSSFVATPRLLQNGEDGEAISSGGDESEGGLFIPMGPYKPRKANEDPASSLEDLGITLRGTKI